MKRLVFIEINQNASTVLRRELVDLVNRKSRENTESRDLREIIEFRKSRENTESRDLREIIELSEKRTRTCTLKIKCVDCGENIWCYSDETLEQLRQEESDSKTVRNNLVNLANSVAIREAKKHT
jgi:hypothetical protein